MISTHLYPWLLTLTLLAFGCEKESTPTDSGTGVSGGTTDGDTDSVADADADGGDTSNTLDSGDTAPSVVDECADIPWEVSIEPFNMLILLDRSSSMSENSIDAQSYATVVQNAIDDIVATNTNSGLVNFALNVFPSPLQCDKAYGDWLAAGNQGNADVKITCDPASGFTDGSAAPAAPLVPFASDQSVDIHQQIVDQLTAVGQCGGTPICKTLEWANAWLQEQEASGVISGNTFVLLATDGAPNCNPALDQTRCISTLTGQLGAAQPEECLDDQCAFNAAYKLIANGFRTFVIGVGNEVSAFGDTLDRIAFWGGGYSDGTIPSSTNVDQTNNADWFFPAASSADLTSALEDITNEAISCTFNVDWSQVPEIDPNTALWVEHRCDSVNILGNLADYVPDTDTGAPVTDTDTNVSPTTKAPTTDNTGKVLLTYMPDCGVETAQQLGWNWADPGLDGASWSTIVGLKEDTTKCKKVRLCPGACDKLKVKGGVKAWSAASARFGCAPDVKLD